MKFICDSNLLLKSINIVEKAIPLKSTLPILENIFLEIKHSELVIRGNNLEMSIEHTMPIESVTQTGKILVKSKTLNHIISKLTDKKLEITVSDTYKMNIKTESIGFDILGLNSEEYPVLPTIENGIAFSLSVKDLKELIKYTIFAVSTDETKKFLQGVLCKKEQDYITFVATDGFRLAIKRYCIGGIDNDFSVILPYKTLNELNKILTQMPDDVAIDFQISNQQVVFKVASFIMISRIIQGQFPDYHQVLPKVSRNKFSVSRRLLIESVERAGVIASESNNVIRILFENTAMTIKSIAPKLGEFKEVISMNCHQTEGEDIKVAFNYTLLLQALKIMETDDVALEFNDGVSPCIIKSEGSDDYIYIIMPIRTSDYHEMDHEGEESN